MTLWAPVLCTAARYVSGVQRNFGPLSFVLLHGTWLACEADPPPTSGVRRSKPGNQPEVKLVSEELSNEATTQRAHTVIPRIGSAYKPKGYSSHPPNTLSILLVFCRINRDRCTYLGESRSTTAARSTPITRAGGRLPCHPTNSLWLPTRRTVSLPCLAFAPKSSTFMISVALAANYQSPSTPVTSVVPSLSSRRNTSRGYHWVTRLLPCRTSMARDPKAELQSRHQGWA